MAPLQPHQIFGRANKQQVIGALKATGSTDPDVLGAARQEMVGGYKTVSWIGIVTIGVGVVFTITIIGIFFGVPCGLFGLFLWRRAKSNMAAVETYCDEYVASLPTRLPAAMA
jgi:hypothetical protein